MEKMSKKLLEITNFSGNIMEIADQIKQNLTIQVNLV